MTDDPPPDVETTPEPMPPAVGARVAPGRAIVWASWLGTALFVAAATAAAADPDRLGAAFAVLAVGYLVLGIALFLITLAVAATRSRTDAIGIGGLFFLQGSAPRSVQVQLMASFTIEVVIAFLAASARIYTPLAFGLLVPMYGLGLAGLWGARHGTFGPRSAPARSPHGEADR